MAKAASTGFEPEGDGYGLCPLPVTTRCGDRRRQLLRQPDALPVVEEIARIVPLLDPLQPWIVGAIVSRRPVVQLLVGVVLVHLATEVRPQRGLQLVDPAQ